ncbi:MAG: lysozyme [Parafilimonas sp.]
MIKEHAENPVLKSKHNQFNYMAPDKTFFDFVIKHEGCKLTAYKDSAGIWTIGIGTILYESGAPVQPGDVITQDRADQLLLGEVLKKAHGIDVALSKVNLTQNQYNALLSFAYNEGIGALLSSSLLKKVKANTSDPTIRDSFMVWDKAHVNGVLVEVQGLKNRRKDEADLYFS